MRSSHAGAFRQKIHGDRTSLAQMDEECASHLITLQRDEMHHRKKYPDGLAALRLFDVR